MMRERGLPALHTAILRRIRAGCFEAVAQGSRVLLRRISDREPAPAATTFDSRTAQRVKSACGGETLEQLLALQGHRPMSKAVAGWHGWSKTRGRPPGGTQSVARACDEPNQGSRSPGGFEREGRIAALRRVFPGAGRRTALSVRRFTFAASCRRSGLQAGFECLDSILLPLLPELL